MSIPQNCDTQYSVGLATNVSVTYAVAGSKADGVTFRDLLNTVEYLLELDEPPLVVTTSYVFDEPDLSNYESVQIALYVPRFVSSSLQIQTFCPGRCATTTPSWVFAERRSSSRRETVGLSVALRTRTRAVI